jgi:tetratricopeptide (TPR) repeat protein
LKNKIFLIVMICIILPCLGLPAFAESGKELFEKGVGFLKQNKNQEAVDAFTAFIAVAPGNPDAYKNRGVAHMKLTQYDEAIKDFERVRKISPDLKGLYSNLGVAWYYKEDYSKAIENYNIEISRSPDNHFAYFNRAICRAELGKPEESMEDINKTLELSPKFYLAICLKGDLYADMNLLRKAKLAYEEAILIKPDEPYAKEQLEGLYTEGLANENLAGENDPAARVQKKSDPLPGKGLEKKQLSLEKESTTTKTKEVKTASLKASKTSSNLIKAGNQINYELQVGAFKVRDNAMTMEKKLEKKGYGARVIEFRRGDITWYLVRTGAYSMREEAETPRKILKDDLGIDSVLRPFDQF